MLSRVHRFVRFSVILLCLALFFAGGARAQGTADVLGTVTDASGGILPGATVTLTNTGTNISQTTKSTGSGDFTFSLVQVGTYSVSVEAMGFKKFVDPNLTLSAGDRARVDAKMEVGAVTQTVEVEATATPALP